MTRIKHVLSRNVQGFEMSYSNNPALTEWFVEYLCKHAGLSRKNAEGERANVIKHITFVFTSSNTNPPVVFGSHADQFNCHQQGFNLVFCIYLHFQESVTGKWYRLIIICYRWNVCHHSFMGAYMHTYLKQQLLGYYHIAPVWRKQLSHKFVPLSDGILVCYIPCYDKCGFYSAFVRSLRVLIQSNPLSIQRYSLAILLTTGWLTTSTNFYNIVIG
jgi:hypothetical protein